MRGERVRAAGPSGRAITTILSAAVLAAGLVACGGSATAPPTTTSSPSASPTTGPTPSPDRSHPVGLIAIGHSGITGEGTGDVGESAPENSWASGSNPAVNSVYLRLVDALPGTRDHVANTGEGGAPSARLAPQAELALRVVPVPALTIIQTIDSDIQCDGTDADNLPAFADNVRKAIQVVVDASPNGHILIVGQLGRPRAAFINELVAEVPSQRVALTGSGPCDFFNATGDLVQRHIKNLTAIIESYEAEQAKVCAEFPQCATDDGIRATYVDTLENFSPDYNHLDIPGQAAEAELIWPVVEELLGL